MRNSKLGLTVVLLLFSAALIAGCQAAPAALGADAETKLSSEVKLLGLVHEIGDEAWIVGEQSLAIAPETEIKGLIVPGDFVKVHALLSLDGRLQAGEIELADDEEAQDDRAGAETEFEGIIESMTPTLWMIGGKSVVVTEQTEVK